MQAYADGGALPHDVLRAVTIDSSEIIGRSAEIGSIEAGKFADLVILTDDPLADIRNTLSIDAVMKNGRLCDADAMDETWPGSQPLGNQWFWEEGPGTEIPCGN